jgi:hypothetical protein
MWIPPDGLASRRMGLVIRYGLIGHPHVTIPIDKEAVRSGLQRISAGAPTYLPFRRRAWPILTLPGRESCVVRDNFTRLYVR